MGELRWGVGRALGTCRIAASVGSYWFGNSPSRAPPMLSVLQIEKRLGLWCIFERMNMYRVFCAKLPTHSNEVRRRKEGQRRPEKGTKLMETALTLHHHFCTEFDE
jgi:hypothetical protein